MPPFGCVVLYYMLDVQHFLQPQIIPYKEYTLHQLQNYFAGLTAYLRENSVSPYICCNHGNPGMTSMVTVLIRM